MEIITITKTIQVRAFIINPYRVIAAVSEAYQIEHDYYQGNENSKNRLSLERCKAILGEEYKDFTDGQIDQIRILTEMLADMSIESFIKKQKVLKSTENQMQEGYNGK